MDRPITHNINFSVFIDKILNGSKCQTIRREHKNPIKVGDKLNLYKGLKTKQYRFIRQTALKLRKTFLIFLATTMDCRLKA